MKSEDNWISLVLGVFIRGNSYLAIGCAYEYGPTITLQFPRNLATKFPNILQIIAKYSSKMAIIDYGKRSVVSHFNRLRLLILYQYPVKRLTASIPVTTVNRFFVFPVK